MCFISITHACFTHSLSPSISPTPHTQSHTGTFALSLVRSFSLSLCLPLPLLYMRQDSSTWVPDVQSHMNAWNHAYAIDSSHTYESQCQDVQAHATASTHTHEWLLSTYITHSWEWILYMCALCAQMHQFTHTRMSCDINEFVLLHVCMSHATRINEPCHIYESVTPPHIWMSHATRTKESCHTYEGDVSTMWSMRVAKKKNDE